MSGLVSDIMTEQDALNTLLDLQLHDRVIIHEAGHGSAEGTVIRPQRCLTEDEAKRYTPDDQIRGLYVTIQLAKGDVDITVGAIVSGALWIERTGPGSTA
jgi:hypothetical protein